MGPCVQKILIRWRVISIIMFILSDPLAEMRGKDGVVTAAKHFPGILQDIQIRSRLSSGNQIMFAYDMVAPAPIGTFRAAVLMEFTDGVYL